ncbi:Spo0E family sporulation regulatory protein-aspartic acid phosphatase [Virgibacillus subterraneus]|nr:MULTISPECIES: Spo0E family sporulation regulatory protein-aspartic acid phosphatase [Virgibacillus]
MKLEIEKLRHEMYHAYETHQEYKILVSISQKLDNLLNKLKQN